MKVSNVGVAVRRRRPFSTFQSQISSSCFRWTKGQTFRCRMTTISLASGCFGITAIRVGQECHHFMERSNVELCNGVDECQPVTHGSSRIEQLELNVVVVSPAFQKQEHLETAAFYRAYLREVKHNDSRVAQRRDRFP